MDTILPILLSTTFTKTHENNYILLRTNLNDKDADLHEKWSMKYAYFS